jgi:hypothetical protein
MKQHVWSKERGLRTLIPNADLAAYKAKYPSARLVKVPSVASLERYSDDGICPAVDGCRVEPDGTCQHGYPSWLLVLGCI